MDFTPIVSSENRNPFRVSTLSLLGFLLVIGLSGKMGLLIFSLPSSANSLPVPPKRSSSAIAITADGALLLAANPDSNTVTLVDTVNQAVIAEIPTGIDPRMVTVDDAGSRAYATNYTSASLTVIDLNLQQAIAQIPVGNRPYGVLVSPDGEHIYVAEQGMDRVSVLDTSSLTVIEIIPTSDRPSGLALSADGHSLYISHLLSNVIQIETIQPYQAFFPLVSQLAQSTVRRQAALTTSLQFPPYSISLWPDSNLVQSIVIAPDGQRAYIPHTRSNTSNLALTFDTTVFPIISQIDLTTRQHLVGQHFDLGVLDAPGVGLPFDAAFTPDGSELWVANAASNNITVIDLAQRLRRARILVSDNPRGIVIAPDGSKAYVNNTLAGTISIINTQTYSLTTELPVTHIPLPPVLLNGKKLFHSSADPRLGRSGWISCNTCHFEGELDGRTWFFGFAGPRNTTSLLGMLETYPLRWSGEWNESADAEFAIRKENFGIGLFNGELRCNLLPLDCVTPPPHQGLAYDLDSLALYLDSLAAPLSPNHAHGEALNAAELRGLEIFQRPALGCIVCHPPPLYTDLYPHDVGTSTSNERIGPAYDTPSLRNLYNSAPYFHDGSALSLYAALTRSSPNSEHDLRLALAQAELQDLIAFLLALPYGP